MSVPVDSMKSSDDKNPIHNALHLLSNSGLEGSMIIVECELEKEPDSWEAWAAKADILYLRNDYSESLECCERSLSSNPENALTWYSKGNALYMLKRYNEAIDCYNKAIEIDPFLAKAWYNKKLANDILLQKMVPRVAMHAVEGRR